MSAMTHHLTPGQLPCQDREAALDALGGDEELLDELIQMVLEDIPGELGRLRALIADPVGARRQAHMIRGAVSNVGARAMVEATQRMENAARDQVELALPLSAVEAEWYRLERTLRAA